MEARAAQHAREAGEPVALVTATRHGSMAMVSHSAWDPDLGLYSTVEKESRGPFTLISLTFCFCRLGHQTSIWNSC